MIYFSICACVILFMLLSYIFIKTYQLCGYQPLPFLKSVIELKLAYGDKNRLVFTKRMIRFILLLFLISTGIFILINIYITNIYLLLLDILLIFLCMPLVIVFVHYLILPLEILIRKYFISKAARKLKRKMIIKIGITGSYGKTSTKNILKAILEKKFKVCATPKNYNTEMGLSRTILENLERQDVFIAEMGARHKGDIKVLAKMVEPDYAIITTIGEQHLETFKNLKTIEDTKYELVEGLKNDGVAVFNGDSLSSRKLFERFEGKKEITNLPNSFAYAENISTTSEGSKFELVLNGKRLAVQTKLLGKCNINNIVTASALAYIMGVGESDIADAICDLEPTKHRLELMKNNFCTIIDDSYNSNIIGMQEALEVLSKFEGKKIVITPGLVELGAEQSQANFKLGAMIADVADELIIMNKVNKNEILSGAISHGFDRKRIHTAETRKKQKEILEGLTESGCVILFENDLPDNYD
ncbi:MAG: UDP-N-acetylmuramoyl-tripeptide--D-alanyl-D-alanine ligase [Clostridia bacterium]|nr:UDP-N-acetylmuramoyl-tripeptide--D-alanyl-D-alanine ligase [Clostridia bacterium]